MEYAEALKKVTATKTKENYMLIKLSYSVKLVLPYKDGVAFMNSLANAESMNDEYDKQHSISEFKRDAVESYVLSHAEYIRYKVAALLGVKPDELIAHEPIPF